MESRESSSTPISRGGWKYQHDDAQDRADFAGWTREDLEAANAQQPEGQELDFSDHPAQNAQDAWEAEVMAILPQDPRPITAGDRVQHQRLGAVQVLSVADDKATCRPIGMWTYPDDPAFTVPVAELARLA